MKHGAVPNSEADLIEIFINERCYKVEEREISGSTLKGLDGIAENYALFAVGQGRNFLIANDARIRLKSGDRLYSMPPSEAGC